MIFLTRQNNSGGHFGPPAVFVFVEADSPEEANNLASVDIEFCGDSGYYAEYDACGCCPCCGHRWNTIDDYDEVTKDGADYYFGEKSMARSEDMTTYMGATAFALITPKDGLIVGDTPEKARSIAGYVARLAQPSKKGR